ncbi:substrate-binding periplasmic protein [Spartinivicinus ruber]|uniref:substrate-binding periplasmic protein n=1 Tax=Spartinivicinus ruber TaxID=2683272 RepID=UPI0013D2E9F5|nr:transporter substrate-binding domain-containing protein [Spartinivicinus ruber]
MGKFITAVLSFFYALNTVGNQVKVGYVVHGPPFHELTNEKLSGGLVYDVAQAIVLAANKQPHFMKLPTNRVDDFLIAVKIHMICFHNPMWVNKPERFHWGPEMFHRKEYFIIPQEVSDITDYSQLKGKSIATHLGYVYSNKVTDLFEQGISKRVNKQKTTAMYNILQLRRVHTLIDNEISFNYLKKQGVATGLRLSSLVDKKYPLHCVFSKGAPEIVQELLNASQEIISNNTMLTIISKYKPTKNNQLGAVNKP